jgi:WD40 repeat protein
LFRPRRFIAAFFFFELTMREKQPLNPKHLRLLCVVLLWASASTCRADEAPSAKEIAVAELSRTTPVDFATEIVPILKSNCFACHNGNNAKGDLSLETPEAMLKGGSNGPALFRGQSGKSRLLLSAAHRLKPMMPPSGNRVGAKPLTPAELGLIRLWIDQGGKGSAASLPAPIAWQPPAAALQPILAVAVTPDAKYAACTRAEQLFVYDLPAGKLMTRLVDPELNGRAHIDLVRSLAFSPRGDILASGGFRTVKLWQRPQTQRQMNLVLDEAATTVAIHPASTLAAFALPSGRIVIHDLTAGKRLRELGDAQGGASAARSLCFSPDGSRLYSGTLDGSVRIWKVEDGSSLGSYPTPGPIHTLVLINQGTQLVTGHEDGQLRVWDVAALTPTMAGKVKPVAEIKAHAKPVTHLAVIPSAPGEVISASEEGRLRHWDVRGAKLLREYTHGSPIAAIAVRPDGGRFASVGNHVVRLWDAANGNLVAERKGDPRALARVRLAEGEIEFAKSDLYFHKQELREAEEAVKRETGILEAAKKQVEAAEKVLVEKQKAAKQPLADNAAAEAGAVASGDALKQANAALKDVMTAVAETRKALGAAQENAARAKAAALKEPKNTDLASRSQAADKTTAEAAARLQTAEKTIKTASEAVQAAEKKNRETTALANQTREKAKQADSQVKEAETAVETSKFTVKTSRQVLDRDELVPIAKKAITAGESDLQQREAARKTAEQAVVATERPLRAVVFSSDGAWLLVGGDDHLIQVFDAQQGLLAEVLEGQGGAVLSLAAGANGKIVSLTAEKQAGVWQAAGAWKLGRTIGRIDDPKVLADRVLKVDFHPNGKWIATAGGEPGRAGELKIWNVADGGLIREFPGAHRDTIFGVQFSPNGDFLATAGADRLVHIFSTADGKLIRTLTGHTNHVRGVAWRADGKVLASCGADNLIKVWNVADGVLLRTETGDINRRNEYRREVTSISFVGGSNLMLATSGDKSVRLHHTGSHQGVRTYAGQFAFMYSAAATPDGKLVVGGGHDGVLRTWNGENSYPIRDFPWPDTTTDPKPK